jgi:SET domain-containing protein
MKKALLDNLYNDVYCRLKPSKTHGIGVFAIKDIPKNTNPFYLSDGGCSGSRIINITKEEIQTLDPEVKKLIHDFYHEENGVYGIPYKGINAQDISFYLNTSNNPNVGFENSKKCSLVSFKTLKRIKKGEELFINYNDY